MKGWRRGCEGGALRAEAAARRGSPRVHRGGVGGAAFSRCGPARAGSGVPPAGAPGRWRRRFVSAGHRWRLSVGGALLRELPPFPPSPLLARCLAEGGAPLAPSPLLAEGVASLPRARSLLRASPRLAGCPCAPLTQARVSHAALPGAVRKDRLSPAGRSAGSPLRRAAGAGEPGKVCFRL